MKLSQLQKRYPNAFHKFYTSRFCENYYLRIANIPILETDVRNHWREITDFMDKQGIHINSLEPLQRVTVGIKFNEFLNILDSTKTTKKAIQIKNKFIDSLLKGETK